MRPAAKASPLRQRGDRGADAARMRLRRALAVLLSLSATTIALAPGIARSRAIIVVALPGMNSAVAPGDLEIRLNSTAASIGSARA
jgi:hypothetical protein